MNTLPTSAGLASAKSSAVLVVYVVVSKSAVPTSGK